MLANFFNTQISNHLDELYGKPVVVFFCSTSDFNWQIYGKQAIDLMGALLAILLFSPILIGCTIAIVSARRVLFFSGKSAAASMKTFTMYKFPRTMVIDAEQRKDELMAYNEMAGPVFKVTDDLASLV